MKIVKLLIALFSIVIMACETGRYSDEDNEKIAEAKAMHNEAMAIFSTARPLLKEVNDARAELELQTGLSLGDTVNPKAQDLEMAAGTGTDINLEDTSALDTDQPAMENIPAFSDTSAHKEVMATLNELNEAQNELLLWMRNIYRVPGYDAIYEDEKTPADVSTHKDYDAPMLLTDMEFIDMPEDASPEEILEKQKQMKDDILRIRANMKKAVENARTAYLNYN